MEEESSGRGIRWADEEGNKMQEYKVGRVVLAAIGEDLRETEELFQCKYGERDARYIGHGICKPEECVPS